MFRPFNSKLSPSSPTPSQPLKAASLTIAMALTTAVHNSLPYIDTEPTPLERSAAQRLIDLEIPSSADQTTHPSLPALPPLNFTPLIEAEHLRIASKTPPT